MADFPDPNTTQSVTMGDVTYKWNGDAWQVDVTAGPTVVTDAYKTVAVSGQNDVVASGATDTLTFVNGANIAITTNASTDSVTVAATGLSATGHNHDSDYSDINHTHALGGLSDVSSVAPTDGQALVWDNANTTWEAGTISGGGGGGGGWTDSGTNTVVLSAPALDEVGVGVTPIEKLTVDGIVALKKQDAAPSATTDYGKIYTKSGTGAGVVNSGHLYHFNEDLLDSIGTNHGENATSLTYVTSSAGGGSSPGDYGKCVDFEGSAATSGGDSWFTIPAIPLGTDDFTIEFWINFESFSASSPNHLHMVIQGASTSVTGGAFVGFRHRWNRPYFYYMNNGLSGGGYIDGNGAEYVDLYPLSTGTWYHLAFVREGAEHRTYLGKSGDTSGTRKAAITYSSGEQQWWDSTTDLYIGRSSGTYGPWNVDAKLDELLITDSALYSDSTYTIPVNPWVSGDQTEVWVQDSADNHTKISPHNKNGEWEYYSKNSKTGKTTRINMENMVRDVEQLTGKKYIEDE